MRISYGSNLDQLATWNLETFDGNSFVKSWAPGAEVAFDGIRKHQMSIANATRSKAFHREFSSIHVNFKTVIVQKKEAALRTIFSSPRKNCPSSPAVSTAGCFCNFPFGMARPGHFGHMGRNTIVIPSMYIILYTSIINDSFKLFSQSSF